MHVASYSSYLFSLYFAHAEEVKWSVKVSFNRSLTVFVFLFWPVGAREVGVFDYNPPTLTLKGSSQGSGAPEALEYVQWPGILRCVL